MAHSSFRSTARCFGATSHDLYGGFADLNRPRRTACYFFVSAGIDSWPAMERLDMKLARTILFSVAATVFGTSAAMAADFIYVPPSAPPPPIPGPAVMNWTGPY